MGIKVENIMKYKGEGIYIGRYNKWKGLEGSVLRNRFDEKKYGRDECIKMFRDWLWKEIKNGNKEVLDELRRIKDLVVKGEDVVLVCWCKPKACHGDVVKSCIEWMIKEEK
jgi:hypothetical protein